MIVLEIDQITFFLAIVSIILSAIISGIQIPLDEYVRFVKTTILNFLLSEYPEKLLYPHIWPILILSTTLLIFFTLKNKRNFLLLLSSKMLVLKILNKKRLTFDAFDTIPPDVKLRVGKKKWKTVYICL